MRRSLDAWPYQYWPRNPHRGEVAPEEQRGRSEVITKVTGRRSRVRFVVSRLHHAGQAGDVVVVIDPEEKSGTQNPISKIVLQNIKVLANGQNIDKPEDQREANSVKAVTLLVTPEQAEKLALASSEGKLQLVMRNSIDQGDEQTPGINKRQLLGGHRPSCTALDA